MTGFSRSYAHKSTGQISAITGGAADLISESRFETPLRNLVFSYGSFNRLSGIIGQNLSASYKIAATNMRVEKTVNRKVTRFVYGQNGRLLYERDLNTNRDSQHLYFQGEPVGMIRNNQLYFVLPDHLGRPELLMANTPAATTVWRTALTAFERAQTLTDTIGGYNLGFPGQYHDEEKGFAYNINRDYDPATGRYLQSDPIELAGGLNTFGYVGGNPVAMVDPSGENWLAFAALAGGCAISVSGGYQATRRYQIDEQRYREEEQRSLINSGNGTSASKRFVCERDEVESGTENQKLLRDALQPVKSGLHHYGPPVVKILVGGVLTAVGARNPKGFAIGTGCALAAGYLIWE